MLLRLLLTPRNLIPVIAGLVCLWLLAQRLDAVDVPQVWTAVGDLGALQWIVAGLATAGSLAAVGQYDVVMHRALGTGIRASAARRAGIVAIALSQTIGFGVVSGALVRWRMLPDLSLWRATTLTAIVAGSFLTALIVLISLTVFLVKPGFLAYEATLGAAVLLGVAGLVVLSFSGGALGRRMRRLPNILVIGSLLGWVALDTGLAAVALYWLLPEGTMLGFALVLPAFLIALGVGMLSGSPAGLGAFELTILALLPDGALTDCLAAILAFRLLYYALPALVALIPLALARQSGHDHDLAFGLRPATRGLDAGNAPEAGVLRQDHGLILTTPEVALGVRATRHLLTSLGPPLGGKAADVLRVLQSAARDLARLPVIYKAPPRLAGTARTFGWSVTRIADEAVLAPRTFTTEGAARRQLRRALRKAQEAGVTTQLARGPLPEAAMAEIHHDWEARNGAERGFSMGRFSLPYLHRQRVYLAYREDRLIAFISLHAEPHEWVLDLMRSTDGAPSGTMQALICHALGDATQAGVARLSLAAVPVDADGTGPLETFVRRHVQRASGATGLRRFKASFAPTWEPRYLITRRKWHAGLAALEIARAIQSPKDLCALPLECVRKSHSHEDYENYEIDSCPRACETAPK